MNERGKSCEGSQPPSSDNSTPNGERRVALVIGNGAYTHAPSLNNPKNDADALTKALTRLGFVVMKGLNLDRNALEDMLGNFEAQITGAEAALVFFAGHGMQVNGCNYLMPVDADIRQEVHLKRRAFSLNELQEIMVGRARTSMVFLDACRDNPFARSLLASIPPAKKGRYMARSGFAEAKASRGAFIAFATAPDNIAQDGTDSSSPNSPFTEGLLAHIETPDLSVGDMMIAVTRHVVEATNGRQEPWQQSSLRERFCFMRLPTESKLMGDPIETTTALTAGGSLEWSQTQWDQLKDTTNIAGLQRFADYANSYYADEALDRIAELETQAAREKTETEQRVLEDSNWAWAKQENTIDAYQRFIGAWPEGRYSTEAESEIAALGQAERERAEAERIRRETQEKERQKDEQRQRYCSEGRILIDPPPTLIKGVQEGWFKPGSGKTEWFKDLDVGPEMVVVPAGKFMRGSPNDDHEQLYNESPQREVTIAKPFAVSRCAITFDEWDACVVDGGCSHKPKDEGWGRGKRPVINVSWEDTKAYILWLSDKTGQPYRLLSEAEWEYAARAGRTTPFWWGTSITPEQANYRDKYTYEGGGGKGKNRENTVPVDEFEANDFGLYNVHGNVWERCEDIWHASYKEAPIDGSAWLEDGDKGRRVVRGGSWISSPRELRSAYRLISATGVRRNYFGFRLARTLKH